MPYPRLRAVVAVLLALAVSVGVAPSASASHDKSPGQQKRYERSIASTFADVCAVTAYSTDCSAVNLVVDEFGAVGWTGSAHPSSNTVSLNSSQHHSLDVWASVSAHELAHLDTWNYIVNRVGTSQAWVDYYDIDHFAQEWLAGKGIDVDSTTAKEIWLDCTIFRYGSYTTYYLDRYNGDLNNWQVCITYNGTYQEVLDRALTESR